MTELTVGEEFLKIKPHFNDWQWEMIVAAQTAMQNDVLFYKSENEEKQLAHNARMIELAKVFGEDVSDEPRYKWVHIMACNVMRELTHLKRAFKIECHGVDRIVEKLGLTQEQVRTEAGCLHVPRILNHIQETLDALTVSTQFGASMSDKYCDINKKLHQLGLRFGFEEPVFSSEQVITNAEFLQSERARLLFENMAQQTKIDEYLELRYELMGVIADVEQGNGFDNVCLKTVKRVMGLLK